MRRSCINGQVCDVHGKEVYCYVPGKNVPGKEVYCYVHGKEVYWLRSWNRIRANEPAGISYHGIGEERMNLREFRIME